MTNLLTTNTESPATGLGDDIGGSRTIWRIAVAAGLVAAALNTGVAATAQHLDVSLAVADEQIPLLGFAQLTFLSALVGLALAAVCSRQAHRPRSLFLTLTTALTLLSMAPVALVDADTATRLVLTATHLIAALIIIPLVAHRLNGETAR